MMVYPEEPSIWTIPHIPALYDDDGDYGGKEKLLNLCISLLQQNLVIDYLSVILWSCLWQMRV